MRAATVWPLVLSVPVGLLCLWTPSPMLAFVTCALAGFLISGQHSVLVVYAQQLLPVRQGFAAGLILGFTFATGALGTWLAGMFADIITLELTMQIVTLMGIPAALLAMTLLTRAITPVPPVTAAQPDPT